MSPEVEGHILNDVLESEQRPEWLSEAAWCQAMLSDRPKELLALYLGVSHLAEICGSETKPKLRQLAAGGIPFQGAPLDFVDIRCLPGQIEVCADKRKVVVRL
jgi:hypothetical protein